jgi:subtilisin family serine protease
MTRLPHSTPLSETGRSRPPKARRATYLATTTTAALVAAAVAWGGTAPSASGGQLAGAARDSSGTTAKQYLVRYRPGTNMRAAGRSLRADGVEVEATVTRAVDVALVTLDRAEARVLARSPEVLSVSPNRRISIAGTQTQPTWGIDRVDQRTLPLSASFTTPDPVGTVEAYVIDTGTGAHNDLQGRVAAGYSSVDSGPGNTDCNGHGTHVAGTIAGATYGVAKGAASVIPVRVLDCTGSGTLFQVINGINWAVGQHQPGVPAVANLSLGGAADSSLDAAIQGLVADGVTVAVAAGNSASDACLVSPAREPLAITVAASNIADQHAAFSNSGTCVDLYAPGVDITSAWPTAPDATMTISGTSMASPHVAGAAAVLLSRQPALTPAQVAEKLVADATPDVLTGVPASTPNRLLFVDQYPAALPPPPPPPPAAPAVATVPDRARSVDAKAKERSARVEWNVTADGGSPITAQRIRVYQSGDKVRSVSVEPGVEHVRVEHLRPGESYKFTVTLRNAVGRSPESHKSEAVEPRR